MARYAKEFYGIAVGSSGYESLIGGGSYSISYGGDGSKDFSSLLIVPDNPDVATINSFQIRCEATQDRGNTDLYKSYIRFFPYTVASYTLNGNLYSSSGQKAMVSDYQRVGTLNDSWKTYTVDLTAYANAAKINKGIRLALNMQFDGTLSAVKTKATVRRIRIYVDYTVPEYAVNLYSGDGGIVTGDGTYEYGTQVTISARADSGYRFVRWSDGNTSLSRTITVTSDITLLAEFERLPPKITDVKLIYQGLNVSRLNKVPCGEGFILSVGVGYSNSILG